MTVDFACSVREPNRFVRTFNLTDPRQSSLHRPFVRQPDNPFLVLSVRSFNPTVVCPIGPSARDSPFNWFVRSVVNVVKTISHLGVNFSGAVNKGRVFACSTLSVLLTTPKSSHLYQFVYVCE